MIEKDEDYSVTAVVVPPPIERPDPLPQLKNVLMPNNDLIRWMLSELLTGNKSDLADIAARSYVHAFQFVKIPLKRNRDSVIRLHIWLDAAAAQQPHSHGWAFRSRIIHGSFTHTLFDVVADGDDDDAHDDYCQNELDLAHPDGTTKLRARQNTTSITRLVPTAVTHLHAGDAYSISRQGIHTMTSDAPGGITLVMTETTHDDVSYVYGPHNTPPPEPAERRPVLTVDELRVYLLQVVECLAVMEEKVLADRYRRMVSEPHILRLG